jgi:hypothetical protein
MAARWEWRERACRAREPADHHRSAGCLDGRRDESGNGIPHPMRAAVAVAGRPMTAAGDRARINPVQPHVQTV